jgi:branched-chain amino acid transport system permease protein
MRRILIYVVFGALALLPPALSDPFIYHVGILVGIESLLALSLHLTLRIGQLSLAQAGLMGLGAYTSALLTRDLGVPFPLAFVAAIAVPAAAAAAIGTAILRVKGVQFALLTFVLGQAIVLVFVECVVPFGGNNGLMNIPSATLGGWTLGGRAAYYGLVVAVVLAAMTVCRRLVGGEPGQVLSGLRQSETLIQSFGINVLSWRRLVFVTGGGIAGAAGSLYAHYLKYISPDAFNITATINVLIMNVIGGVGVLFGPILGALILVSLPDMFRSLVLYQQLLYGLSLLALIMFMPRGIGALLQRDKP